MDEQAKEKLDQLRISMKHNPEETVCKIKEASQKRNNILKRFRHASKLISMVQSIKKTKKTAKEFKGEIKKLKNVIKEHKRVESDYESQIEDANIKIQQLLTSMNCSNFSEYISLNK